jgi:hypothetical protein
MSRTNQRVLRGLVDTGNTILHIATSPGAIGAIATNLTMKFKHRACGVVFVTNDYDVIPMLIILADQFI